MVNGCRTAATNPIGPLPLGTNPGDSAKLSTRQVNDLCIGLGGQVDSLVAHIWHHERCHMQMDTALFRTDVADVPAVVEGWTRGDSSTLWSEVQEQLRAANDTVTARVSGVLHATPFTGPGFNLYLKDDTTIVQKSLWVPFTSSTKWAQAC
jgi:hypothetical protein